MEKKVKIIKCEDVKPALFPEAGMQSRRVVTKWRENSEIMSLSVVTIEKGHEATGIYEEQDEIVYFIEGAGKISWKGGETEIRPGIAMFIPAGNEYSLQTTERSSLVGILSPPIE